MAKKGLNGMDGIWVCLNIGNSFVGQHIYRSLSCFNWWLCLPLVVPREFLTLYFPYWGYTLHHPSVCIGRGYYSLVTSATSPIEQAAYTGWSSYGDRLCHL